MTLVRLLLVLVAIVSAAAPVLAGDELDCFQGADLELRIAGCTQLIARSPHDTTGYHNRAAAYVLAGDLDKAIADYTKVIEAAPDNASAYANRSRAYADWGNFAQAAEDKEKALELMAKSIARPTMIGPKANGLPSEPNVKSPPRAKPTPRPEPPVRAVQVVKAEPPLVVDSAPKVEPAFKSEPTPKANDKVAGQSLASTFWAWFTPPNGKTEPPLKAAPALKVEPSPKAVPLLKAEPAPNNGVGQEATPDTLVGWLKQLNGKKEPPLKAASAAKVEPAPGEELAPAAELAMRAEPSEDDDMGPEEPADTLMAWLKQLNSKNAKP
jgi:hypothetical protein